MYKVVPSSAFKKDLRRLTKQGKDIALLKNTVKVIASGGTLPEKFHDHSLTGKYTGCRDCHISPDWILIYRIENDRLCLVLSRTGSHSDLF